MASVILILTIFFFFFFFLIFDIFYLHLKNHFLKSHEKTNKNNHKKK